MEPFVRPFSGNPPTEKIKNWLRLHTARKALKKADRIIAISNFVKEYLVNQLRIDSQRIGLVYHGIEKAIDMPKRPIVIPETCRDFLFTAGSIRPARGLEDILKALRDLATWNNKNPLVIAGSTDPVMTDYQKKLIKWVDKNNLSENVIWAGQFNEQEMAWCYQNCSAFIMTSRVESFGQIAVEAMANGCLCISANNPCLPEIIEDAAIYYTPGNGGELCEAIKAVLSWDQPKKIMVSKKAKLRASQFSWDVCAEKTIEEFKRVMQTFNFGRGTRCK
jgi:glycosyltransferase involved in cell wall biosynthesis